MEYFELGGLERFITPKLTEEDSKVIGRQLLEGREVLHGYHLAHRDLKPANIFVARLAPDWWIKLGDFGIVRRICTEQNSKLIRIGTLDYMAPEILLDNDDEDQDSPYTLAVDIWSLGCVLFRLLTQQFPFPEVKHLRQYWRLKKPFPTDILIEHNVSEDGVSLVSEMMKPKPADRMTVTMALSHSWGPIQKSTSAPGFFDSLEENLQYELDDNSPNKGPATESSKSTPVNVFKSHIEDDLTFSNAAIAFPTRNRHENRELGPYNLPLTSEQNEEVAQLRKQMPDAEDRIFDSIEENTDTLESRSNLADSYLKLGLHEKAMQLFQQIHEARRRLLGDEHPETLRALNNLVKSFTQLRWDQKALQFNQLGLEQHKRVLGDEHPDTLQSMSGLAVCYSNLGRYQEALQLDKQTLELRKRVLGDEHPDTLQSMNGLALSYTRLGQDQEALQLYQQTLELRKSALGDEHPDTLQSMNGLATSYYELRRVQEALQLHQQTLELRKRVLGHEHPDTLQSMGGVARSYSNLGRDQEAFQLYQQTLELRKRVLGDEHPDTFQSMHNLAVSYFKLGQYLEALQLAEQTVQAQRRILGPGHPHTILSAKMFAFISRKANPGKRGAA